MMMITVPSVIHKGSDVRVVSSVSSFKVRTVIDRSFSNGPASLGLTSGDWSDLGRIAKHIMHDVWVIICCLSTTFLN
jgi:hypothetical protein